MRIRNTRTVPAFLINILLIFLFKNLLFAVTEIANFMLDAKSKILQINSVSIEKKLIIRDGDFKPVFIDIKRGIVLIDFNSKKKVMKYVPENAGLLLGSYSLDSKRIVCNFVDYGEKGRTFYNTGVLNIKSKKFNLYRNTGSGYSGEISGVSHDEKKIISCPYGIGIIFYDLAKDTRNEIFKEYHISCPRFSPDGNLYAFFAEGKEANYLIIQQIGVQNKKEVKLEKEKYDNELPHGRTLSWSASGKYIAGIVGHRLYIWKSDGENINIISLPDSVGWSWAPVWQQNEEEIIVFYEVDSGKESKKILSYPISLKKYEYLQKQKWVETSEDKKYKTTYEYDKSGNKLEIKSYYVGKKLTEDKDGIVLTIKKYDKQGRILEQSSFTMNGILIGDNYKYEYDGLGNKIEEYCYYLKDGDLKQESDATAIYRRKYDKNGKLVEAVWYGIDRKPIVCYGYQDNALNTTKTYSDNNGKTEYTAFSKYDDYGREIETEYRDADNKLVKNEQGFAVVRYKYNETGQRIEESYFNADEKLSGGSYTGFSALIQWVYTSTNSITGKIKEERYYDFNKKLLYMYRFKYDEKNREIERSCCDENGNLKENHHGIAIYRNKYDELGNYNELSYYGTNGKLKENIDEGGMAIRRHIRDGLGHEEEDSYYGADGKLKNESFSGIAIHRRKCNANGDIIEDTYYGSDEKLKGKSPDDVAIIRYKYDEKGNSIKTMHYDSKGNLKFEN